MSRFPSYTHLISTRRCSASPNQERTGIATTCSFFPKAAKQQLPRRFFSIPPDPAEQHVLPAFVFKLLPNPCNPLFAHENVPRMGVSPTPGFQQSKTPYDGLSCNLPMQSWSHGGQQHDIYEFFFACCTGCSRRSRGHGAPDTWKQGLHARLERMLRFSFADARCSDRGQWLLKGEGIEHIVTLTHANVAERAIRTIKKMITDRALVTKGAWTILLQPVLNQYTSPLYLQ